MGCPLRRSVECSGYDWKEVHMQGMHLFLSLPLHLNPNKSFEFRQLHCVAGIQSEIPFFFFGLSILIGSYSCAIIKSCVYVCHGGYHLSHMLIGLKLVSIANASPPKQATQPSLCFAAYISCSEICGKKSRANLMMYRYGYLHICLEQNVWTLFRSAYY